MVGMLVLFLVPAHCNDNSFHGKPTDFSFTTKTNDEIDLTGLRCTGTKVINCKNYCCNCSSYRDICFYQETYMARLFEIVLRALSRLHCKPAHCYKATQVGKPDESRGNDQLETEVEILESPSILMPVFDGQTTEATAKNDADWRYADWLKGKFAIQLVKGTSVLELAIRTRIKI